MDFKSKYYDSRIEEHECGQRIVSHCGGSYRLSNRFEDAYDHIDLWWKDPKKGIEWGIDVKKKCMPIGVKGIWVEFKNVLGKPGWLYGKANYIAFVHEDDTIYLVRRTDLLKHSIANKPIGLTYHKPNDCYIPYQRYGREDLIMMIPFSSIKALSVKTLTPTIYQPDLFDDKSSYYQPLLEGVG